MDANFGEELNMEFASFQGDAVFLGSHITGNANFFRSYLSDVNFTDAILEGDVQFSEATLGEARFTGSQFEGATFNGTAQFPDVVFSSETDFKRGRFCGEASFSSSRFQAKTHFDFADFQGQAFFRGTLFVEAVDFTGTKFQKDLSLESARIHIMRLHDASFAGQISLHNAEFVRLEARWPDLCDHLAYDGAAYLSLAKNFRNLEWFEGADDCYYHYGARASQPRTLSFGKKGP